MNEKQPENFKSPLVLQQLADLGYKREVRDNLSLAEVEEIIAKNTTFETFHKLKEEKTVEEERRVKAKKVPEELKLAYREAYEEFTKHIEGIILDSEKERLNIILKLCGSGSVVEVENYMKDHELELSDEEIVFLEKTIEYKKTLESIE